MLPPITPPYGERTVGGNNAFHNFYNDYSHIAEPNLRRRLALSEIDKVPFSLYREQPWILVLFCCPFCSVIRRCFFQLAVLVAPG